MREKKCRSCQRSFKPMNTLQVACSPKCALSLAVQKREKEQRKKHREDKDRIKSRSEWLSEAQSAFNKYIRSRDAGRDCVSCGKPDNGNHQRHASHFRSVGAASHLRFNLLNVHSSCATCNNIKSGNILGYLQELPNRIGRERTYYLVNANFEKRYSIEYAKRVKKIFNKRARIYLKLFR